MWLVDCGVDCVVVVGAGELDDVVITLGRGWRGWRAWLSGGRIVVGRRDWIWVGMGAVMVVAWARCKRIWFRGEVMLVAMVGGLIGLNVLAGDTYEAEGKLTNALGSESVVLTRGRAAGPEPNEEEKFPGVEGWRRLKLPCGPLLCTETLAGMLC